MGQLVSKFSHFLHKWKDKSPTSPVRELSPKRLVVNPELLSTMVDPELQTASEVGCRDVHIVEKSPSRDLKQKG